MANTTSQDSALRPNRSGVALMSVAHLINDIYQGVVPAMLPFLVAERQYTYAAVAGITMAATVISSIAQPVFGWLGDKRPRRWLIASGMLIAAAGVAVAGLTSSYLLTWIFIAISGFGIAAFHPEAARAARQAAGNSNRSMSLFALGGNGGYALGSLIATPVFVVFGVRGTPLLAFPAIIMALVLFRWLTSTLDGPADSARPRMLPTGTDDWRSFGILTSVVIIRSILFLGISSFIGLYFIDVLGRSEGWGGAVVTAFLFAGAVGTMLGGWLADLTNRLVSIRAGLALALPAIAGIVLSSSWVLTFICVILAGVALFMPFSVMVMLGQDYLPNRIGTASGVTVGLSVTVGGLVSPLLGVLADNTSLTVAIATLLVFPALGLGLSAMLREPHN